jgi:phosphoribosylaminoimidazole-succinocarboxamide synthase
MKEAYFVDDPLGSGKVEVLEKTDLYQGDIVPHRGKIRDVYDLGDSMIIVTTDRISAYDVVYPTLIPHKGTSLHALSEFWFKETNQVFPNHFKESVDERTMRVKKADRIDLEWVCRAYLYGSAWRAYRDGARTVSGVSLPDGLVIAEELPQVVLTPTTKEETGHDKEISKSEAIETGLVTRDEWVILEEATYQLFDAYRKIANDRGIIIPDFKLEFGRIGDQLIQIDEPPTHDSARFWSKKHYEAGKPQEAHCLDKEFLRSYLRLVGYTGDGVPPSIPTPVVREVAKRCIASYEVISRSKNLEDYDLKTVAEVMEEL